MTRSGRAVRTFVCLDLFTTYLYLQRKLVDSYPLFKQLLVLRLDNCVIFFTIFLSLINHPSGVVYVNSFNLYFDFSRSTPKVIDLLK